MNKNSKPRNNSRYAYIQLKEINGERQYDHRMVRVLPKGVTPEGYAETVAKTFYHGKPDKDDDYYYFQAGEVAVKVKTVSLISEEEYDIMSKYMNQ